MLAATAAWTFRNYQRARYIRELSANVAAGRSALEQGDFFEAQRLLDVADRAARGLGGESPQARLAIQLNREAYLWSNLCVNPVEQFFDAYSDELAGGEAGKREREFARQYGGRTLIVSGWLTREPPPTALTEGEATEEDDTGGEKSADLTATSEPGTAQRGSVRLEWAVCGENYRVELDLGDGALFDAARLGESHEVVFGVEIAGLARSPTDPSVWKLQIVPQRSALLTAAEPLLRAGWPTTDELSEVLARQRSWLEIEP